MTSLTMRQLFEAGVHFGHQVRYRNPKTDPFIYGVHQHIHIINLEKTLVAFQEALQFVRQLGANHQKVLFVGTKLAARDAIREEATRASMPYVDYRWLGGTLTNYKTVRQSIRRFKDMEQQMLSGHLQHLTKKEGLSFQRRSDKFQHALGGIKNMGGLPDALFVVGIDDNAIAVTEANRLSIPVIGIIDTNNNPQGIQFPIPGNDDASGAVRLYSQLIADALLEGKQGAENYAPQEQASALPAEQGVVEEGTPNE